MFDESLTIKTSEGDVTQKPYQMLQPIKKAKYPAITEVSLPNLVDHTREKYSSSFALAGFIIIGGRSSISSSPNHVWSYLWCDPRTHDEHSLNSWCLATTEEDHGRLID